MGYFAGYDINTNPGAANSFATAAFQFITSLLPGSIQYFDQVSRRIDALQRMQIDLSIKNLTCHETSCLTA